MKLDLDPTNRLLRRQVGDLYYDMRMYREAAFHYLQLYELSPAEYRGSAFERKIVQTLDQLHSQYAVERNLDDAIYFFQLLRSIDPLAPEETIDYYEYLKEAEEKPGTDADAKIHLARFAEERQGLESFAIENYRGALELDPGNADARQAIDRYAMIWAQEAQRRFRDGNYFGVMAARERLEREFPNSSEAMLLVADLVTKAQIEIARVERSRAEEARRLVEQGDQDFERALGFYNNIFNVQTAGQISFSGAKNDAQRYFYYAIQSYQDAMAVDPALRTDPRSVVPRKITDANNYINRLTAGPPRTGGILPRRTQGRIPPPRP
jgi:tetratricopeptide (TPR) repeat protein